MASLQPLSQTFPDDDDINLAEIGLTLSRQWRRITKITVAVTVLTVVYVLLSRPGFTVTGTLYLGDAHSDNSPAASGQSLDSGLGFLAAFQSVSDVETQIQLIQAKSLLEKAILETGLNSPVVSEDAPNLRTWNWRLFYGNRIEAFEPKPQDVEAEFATPAVLSDHVLTYDIVFGDNGSYQISRGGGIFSSSTVVLTGMLGQPASGGGLSLMLKPAVEGAVPAVGTRFKLMVQSASALADALIEKGAFFAAAGGTVDQPTKVANLRLDWGNPYEGREFLDELMQDFISTQLSWKTESASKTQAYVSNQLEKVNHSLSSADQKLAAYQAETGLLDISWNAKTAIEQLSTYEVQRTTILLQEEALQELKGDITNPGDNLNPYLVSSADDLTLGQLAGTLANAQALLQAQEVQFTGNATQIQIQRATVLKLEDSIRTLVSNDLDLATKNLSGIDVEIAKYEAALKAEPAQALQVVELNRSSDVYGQLYVLLMEKEEEAEVSKAATIIDTRVVTAPEIPLAASKPKLTTSVLIGMFLGLFGSMGVVLTIRAISGRFQSDEEIRRAVPLPVYAMVPKRGRGEASASVFSERLQSPFSEAFRLLRSNLYQSATLQKSRVVLITSAASGDGKTTVAANLAQMLADDNKKVVLVDADLHRGRVHEALKVDQSPGLTQWLVTTQRPRLQPVPGQRFLVLTAGAFPPNPSELVNEPALGVIFEQLRAEFDFVIVDCPPLPVVSDTMSLGQFADLLLSVVHIEHTARRSFFIHNETISTLDRRHGMIINGVIGGAYGYGYRYSYGYGERDASPDTRLVRFGKFVKRLF